MNIHQNLGEHSPRSCEWDSFWLFSVLRKSFSTPPRKFAPVPVAFCLTLGGFSYPLGTQNLSVTESREDECQILSTPRSAHWVRAGHVAQRGGKSGVSNKPIFPQPLCLSKQHNTAKNPKLTQVEHACSNPQPCNQPPATRVRKQFRKLILNSYSVETPSIASWRF